MRVIPKIIGIGTAVPERSCTQAEARDHYHLISEEKARDSEASRALYRLSRIAKRHSVLLGSLETPCELVDFYPPALASGPTTGARMRIYEEEAPRLAHTAANNAVTDSEICPEEITHLITISCTGFFAPGIDIHLIHSLGLNPQVQRTHIGFMGCHAAINGLQSAVAIVKSDPNATVLMCCVELCSLHFSYQNKTDRIVSNSLFSDGAAAIVVRSRENNAGSHWHCLASFSSLLPETKDIMGWKIGDHGFEMELSTLLAKVIERELPDLIQRGLASSNLDVKQIESWAVHPGGPRILTAVEKALELSFDALKVSQGVLQEYGNMSSATVLFVLDQLSREGAKSPCLMLAFGPGVVCEAAVMVRGS